jgi:hypothetical protein
MNAIRIARPRRRRQRRTELARLDAVTDTADSREVDALLARIDQLLGVV